MDLSNNQEHSDLLPVRRKALRTMARPLRVVVFLILVLAVRSACRADDGSADQILAHAKALYSQQGPKEALPEYERALAAYRQADNKLGEAITIGFIGNCYKRLGDYPKALEMLNASLSMK